MTRLAFGLIALLGITTSEAAALAQTEPPAAVDKPAGEAAGPDESKAAGDVGDLPAGERPTGIGRRTWDDIVVVPRKAFLKQGRLELAPFSGVSLNDVLIRHYSLGGDLNYYLTDVFAVGVQGQYFRKERTDREGIVGLQYNRVATLNKFKYSGALNFTYVPGYGKFTLFNSYIFHWDVFASAGVGVMWTEIIPRIVGEATWQNMNIAPDFGVGTRLFLNDWITFSVSFRDYVFNDKFEPTDRVRGEDLAAVKERATSQFVNNIMLYAAVSFYLPTSFDYRTPR